MRRLFLVAMLGGAMLPCSAFAQACAEFTAPNAELQLRYDPFSPARIDRIFTLRLRRLDDKVTAVRVLFADPDPDTAQPVIGVKGPSVYRIDWTRDGGRQVFALGGEQPNATNGALIGFGNGASGGARNESFRIIVPAGQDVGAGNYYQALDLRYQCYSGDEPLGPVQIQSDARVAIDLRVEERIRAFIGSPGIRRGTLDFGMLTSDVGRITRSLALTAQSTVPYEVEIRAENGTLVRGRREEETIPYSLWFAELPVHDGSRVGCPRTPAPSGRSHMLRAEVNGADAAKVPAGNYSDVVTITFSPRVGLGGDTACSVVGG